VLADWSDSLRIDALLWLVSLTCLVVFGDVLAREPYADYQFHSQSHDGFVRQREQFRWRPLNEEEEKLHQNSSTGSYTGRVNKSSVLYPPAFTDYAETPPGLPRGVYRPVEERHTIIPHKNGFRFRTLTPAEQERIKRRNALYNQYWLPERSEKQSLPPSDSYSYSVPRRQEAYRFRPDKRLDKKRGGNWERSETFPYNPAFSEAYQAPVFRPD
jgi:hypothetical protein